MRVALLSSLVNSNKQSSSLFRSSCDRPRAHSKLHSPLSRHRNPLGDQNNKNHTNSKASTALLHNFTRNPILIVIQNSIKQAMSTANDIVASSLCTDQILDLSRCPVFCSAIPLSFQPSTLIQSPTGKTKSLIKVQYRRRALHGQAMPSHAMPPAHCLHLLTEKPTSQFLASMPRVKTMIPNSPWT